MSLEAQDSPTIRTTCGVLILLFIVIIYLAPLLTPPSRFCPSLPPQCSCSCICFPYCLTITLMYSPTHASCDGGTLALVREGREI